MRLNHFAVLVRTDRSKHSKALHQDWQECGAVRIAQRRNIVSCGFKYGRLLRVQLKGTSCLTLCEVEVYGKLQPPLPTLAPSGLPTVQPSQEPRFAIKLLSKNRPVKQSGVKHNGYASRAVDGDRNGKFSAESCTHTTKAPGSWWMVDLQGLFHIQKVVVWNRQDCCMDRLNHFIAQSGVQTRKEISWTTCGRVSMANSQNSIGCAYNRAQWIKIQLLRTATLTLCEVEIYGSIRLPDKEAVYLLSSGRPAKQSSTSGIGGASKAVDSEKDGDFSLGSCTKTTNSRNPWWQIDLLDVFSIHHVLVWNRVDCCASRLNGMTVLTGLPWRPCGSVKHAQRKNKIDCQRTRARHIRVQLVGQNYLTLCEVEVYGSR